MMHTYKGINIYGGESSNTRQWYIPLELPNGMSACEMFSPHFNKLDDARRWVDEELARREAEKVEQARLYADYMAAHEKTSLSIFEAAALIDVSNDTIEMLVDFDGLEPIPGLERWKGRPCYRFTREAVDEYLGSRKRKGTIRRPSDT